MKETHMPLQDGKNAFGREKSLTLFELNVS